MKKLLIFIDWYLPGYKAGGQIPSVANIIELIKDKMDVSVVTSDRDEGDELAYKGIAPDKWLYKKGVRIMYLSPKNRTKNTFQKILSQEFDTVYFNSFFSSRFTLLPLWLLKKNHPETKIVLAPRGMLGKGALAIKPIKKRIFIWLAKLGGLYRSITWHASSKLEKKEIEAIFGSKQQIHIASDISVLPGNQNVIRKKEAEKVKIFFLSRITPKKNLFFALKLLQQIPQGKIIFDIIGPVDDEKYWQKCREMIKKMPKNIKINYLGSIPNSKLINALKKYHFFLFPTQNENYGHVIAESLAAGCPVILSTETPWQDLETGNAGWVIPLTRQQEFVQCIEKCTKMEQDEFDTLSKNALAYVRKKINNSDIIQKNIHLFLD